MLIIGLVSFVAWFVLHPAHQQAFLERRLSLELGQEVKIGKVENAFKGDGILFTLENVTFSPDPLASAGPSVEVDRVSLRIPYIHAYGSPAEREDDPIGIRVYGTMIDLRSKVRSMEPPSEDAIRKTETVEASPEPDHPPVEARAEDTQQTENVAERVRRVVRKPVERTLMLNQFESREYRRVLATAPNWLAVSMIENEILTDNFDLSFASLIYDEGTHLIISIDNWTRAEGNYDIANDSLYLILNPHLEGRLLEAQVDFTPCTNDFYTEANGKILADFLREFSRQFRVSLPKGTLHPSWEIRSGPEPLLAEGNLSLTFETWEESPLAPLNATLAVNGTLTSPGRFEGSVTFSVDRENGMPSSVTLSGFVDAGVYPHEFGLTLSSEHLAAADLYALMQAIDDRWELPPLEETAGLPQSSVAEAESPPEPSLESAPPSEEGSVSMAESPPPHASREVDPLPEVAARRPGPAVEVPPARPVSGPDWTPWHMLAGTLTLDLHGLTGEPLEEASLTGEIRVKPERIALVEVALRDGEESFALDSSLTLGREEVTSWQALSKVSLSGINLAKWVSLNPEMQGKIMGEMEGDLQLASEAFRLSDLLPAMSGEVFLEAREGRIRTGDAEAMGGLELPAMIPPRLRSALQTLISTTSIIPYERWEVRASRAPGAGIRVEAVSLDGPTLSADAEGRILVSESLPPAQWGLELEAVPSAPAESPLGEALGRLGGSPARTEVEGPSILIRGTPEEPSTNLIYILMQAAAREWMRPGT